MNEAAQRWLIGQQTAFNRKSGLRRYYAELFAIVERELQGARDIVELGTGIAMSRRLMPATSFTATDAFETPFADAVVDAQSLPYRDASLDAVFAVDVLHHIPHPKLLLEEAARVLRPQGRLVLIEPYASPVGAQIYRLLHPEPIYLEGDVWSDRAQTSDDVMDANQGVATLMFARQFDVMPKELASSFDFRTSLHSFLSFIATGGINRSIGLPAPAIALLLNFERRLPERVMRIFAMRMVIVGQRRA